ncbi:MAG: elements of external origin [Alphaproteobacteria bacterium]
MGVSQREYARMRGVSLSAVQKAIKSGRIKLNSDKTITPEQADIEWQKNTNPARNKFKEEENDVQGNSFQGFSEGNTPKVHGGYQQVRTAREYYQAMFVKERLRKYKEELVERAKVNEHIFRLGRALRDALLLFPTREAPLIAARLNVDEHQVRVILDEQIKAFLSEFGEPTSSL